MNTKTLLASLFILSASFTGLVACGGSNGSTTGVAGSGGSSAAGSAGGAGGTSAAGAGGTSAAGAGGATAGADGGAGTGAAGADAGAAGSDGGAAGAEGGAAGSGAAGADGGAGACNALTLSGPEIQKAKHAEGPPAMTGGVIVPGTYILTAMDKYNNTSGGTTHRETWVFTATHVEVVSEDSSTAGGAPQYHSGDYTTAGNVLTLVVTCPAAEAGTLKTLYTSGDGKLSTGADPATTDEEVHVFTKQ